MALITGQQETINLKRKYGELNFHPPDFIYLHPQRYKKPISEHLHKTNLQTRQFEISIANFVIENRINCDFDVLTFEIPYFYNTNFEITNASTFIT